MKVGDYILFKSGTENRRMGFLINKRLKNAVIRSTIISDRLCIIQLGLHQKRLSVVNVHALTEENKDWIKEEFYEKIEEILQWIPNGHIK